MMKTVFKNKPLLQAGLFTLLCLTGCAQPQKSMQVSLQNAPYKRTIELSSNHPQLQSLLEQKIIQSRNLVLQPQNGFSEFHLVVDTSLERIKTLETKPRLMGRLQKAKVPVTFRSHYKVNNQTSLTLAQGHLSETTETLPTIYPSLSATAKINPQALQKMAEQILQETRTHIAVTPWSTRVTAVKDDNHVTIAVGEKEGLELGDTFTAESHPKATLQVVMFETLASGGNRAVLGLMEGFLPQAGRKLIADK